MNRITCQFALFGMKGNVYYTYQRKQYKKARYKKCTKRHLDKLERTVNRMPDSEKVIESLEMCERDGCGFNCTRCHYETDTKRSCIENLMHDALELLKKQQIEIERLKGELKAECKNAEHDAYGCLGYGKSSQNDELIEKCKNCEKYTGNITGAEAH